MEAPREPAGDAGVVVGPGGARPGASVARWRRHSTAGSGRCRLSQWERGLGRAPRLLASGRREGAAALRLAELPRTRGQSARSELAPARLWRPTLSQRAGACLRQGSGRSVRLRAAPGWGRVFCRAPR